MLNPWEFWMIWLRNRHVTIETIGDVRVDDDGRLVIEGWQLRGFDSRDFADLETDWAAAKASHA